MNSRTTFATSDPAFFAASNVRRARTFSPRSSRTASRIANPEPYAKRAIGIDGEFRRRLAAARLGALPSRYQPDIAQSP